MDTDKQKTLIELYIPSTVGGAVSLSETHPGTRQETVRHYIQGAVNGERFQVPCDEKIEVPPEIAELLLRLIQHPTH